MTLRASILVLPLLGLANVVSTSVAAELPPLPKRTTPRVEAMDAEMFQRQVEEDWIQQAKAALAPAGTESKGPAVRRMP